MKKREKGEKRVEERRGREMERGGKRDREREREGVGEREREQKFEEKTSIS